MKFRNLKEPVQNLVTFLLTISLPPEKQKEIHGIGNPGLEMPEYVHFDDGYKEDIERIQQDRLLPENNIAEIDNFISELRDKSEEFWLDFESSSEWNSIRNKAFKLYRHLGLGELEIIIDFKTDIENEGTVQTMNYFVVIEKERTENELKSAIETYSKE